MSELDYSLTIQKQHAASIVIKNGDAEYRKPATISGCNARVFHKGAWGMAYRSNSSDIEKLIPRAVNAALISAQKNKSKVISASEPGIVYEKLHTGTHSIKKPHMLDVAKLFDGYISDKYRDIESCQISIHAEWNEKQLVASNGALLHTIIPKTMMFIRLSKNSHTCETSFHAPEDISFLEHSAEKIHNAIDILYAHLRHKENAILIPDTYTHCVLSPRMAAKLIHETLGHQAESDFILENFPYSTFVRLPSLLSSLNVIDYAHQAFGKPCPCPMHIDDEGTTARDVQIIKNGQVCESMTNRETAASLKAPLTGNAQAIDYKHEPVIRMRNTAILPDKNTADDIIASIDNGYYLVDGSEGGSEPNGDFAYRISIGYRIKNGEICESLNDNAIVWGSTADFLKSISMIGNDFEWCVDDCTKAEQKMYLASGAPTIKAKMNIGIL